jgi:adenosylmethionine---8-amino-7-oxononanoate aminotransferase
MTLLQRDKACIWHPFEHQKTEVPPIVVQRAEGAYVFDEAERAYLDLVSSWWVNPHGHAHPVIAKAIYEQALTLEHVMFSGFTHEPAVLLAESLSARLPQALGRFFYSDNGSTAVEVALKMAFQYWMNQGEHRHLFLSFEGAYHGDTFGAMSVGRTSGYHDPFRSLLFEVLTIPFADTWEGDLSVESKENASLIKLDELLSQHAHQISALIVEPLIQGAAGMRMCRPEFIEAVVHRVQSHGILVIFDEVMTGFGRTGTLFALDQLRVVPDFLCLSKALSGGFLPLALTVTKEDIYRVFLAANARYTFSHGHSYTANALACRAALASLQLFTPEVFQSIDAIHSAHRIGLSRCMMHPAVMHTRTMGAIAAFEVKTNSLDQLNAFLKQKFLEQGLIIRPLANTIYFLPPYCVTEDALLGAYEKVLYILDDIPLSMRVG